MYDLRRYHFKEQENGEEILEIIRRHWFDIFWQFVPLILVFLMGIVVFIVSFLYGGGVISLEVLLFMSSFLGLVLWIVAGIIWVDYYLDVWIITNHRVVNVRQRGLFIREVSELRYNKIQDITTEVHGFIPTILHYGDVFVQTAGSQPRFQFDNVPYPYKIKDRLVLLQKRLRKQDLSEVKEIIHNQGEEQM